MVKLFVLTALLACACANTSFGRCKTPNYLVNGVNINQYLGSWYENARSADMPWEKGNCQIAEYSLNADGSIKVDNSQITTGPRVSAIGRAVPGDNANTLDVSFSNNLIGRYIKGDYEVINTDYTSYSLVYSCSNFLLWKVEYIWVLSRTPQLDTSTLGSLVSYAQSTFGIGASDLHFTKQDSATCGY